MSANSPVYIGTCGYSYPEWIDAGIYPPGTESSQMLGLYGHLFPVVELNYTWYQMIRAETVERMLAAGGASLLFCAKLTRTMTHEIGEDWRDSRLGPVPPGHSTAPCERPSSQRTGTTPSFLPPHVGEPYLPGPPLRFPAALAFGSGVSPCLLVPGQRLQGIGAAPHYAGKR